MLYYMANSELETNSFVMQANVLNASAGYLIEAHMELATGETSIGIWLVNTNILPYGGSCEIEDSIWGKSSQMCFLTELVFF